MDNQISEIKNRIQRLISLKNQSEINKELAELNTESAVEGFWNNNEKAQEVMKKIGDLNSEVDTIKKISSYLADVETIAELREPGEEIDSELAKTLTEITSELDKLEIETFLSDKFDKNDAIFSIHAGQGGTEACDWAEMLMRMYMKFFEKKNWTMEIIDKVVGDEAGIKSITLEVKGKNVYGYLKAEHGTHRLVRVSPFNAQGLRQTSFAGVEVSPLIDDDMEVDLKEEDIDFAAVRSSGPGGQNVNKTSSSVRLTHKPTGISVYSSTYKSQLQNRKAAMALLRGKLYQIQKEEQDKEINKTKGEYKIAGWGNQIRNYVLHPYKLVKDLRTGVETDQVNSVLDGEIDKFIDEGIRLGNS